MGYVDEVLAKIKEKNASEPEFIQAAQEVLESLRPVIDANEAFGHYSAATSNSTFAPCRTPLTKVRILGSS